MKTFLNTAAFASAIAFAAANEGAGGAVASADIYDFSDLSDLPEEMQTRLTANGGVEPEWVAEVEDIIVNAPKPLSLAQVIAVAIRKKVDLPAETTVRSRINSLKDEGRVSKPTRQTYAAPGAKVEETVAPAAQTAGVEPEVDNDDPLADL